MEDEDRRMYLLQKYVSDIATDEELKALEDPDRKEQVLKELLDRAENFRKIKVFGDGYKVEGNTYPVRNILKDYGAKWDRYERVWYGGIEDVKMFWKMAHEINAKVIVQEIPSMFLGQLSPNKLKIHDEMMEIARRFGEEDIVGVVVKAEDTHKVWEHYKENRDIEVER